MNPFRPRPSDSTIENMSFRFSLKIFSRSALAGGPFFFSEPEPGLGGPDKRKYLSSSNHNCICMTSEVRAVQCLPLSGFVNLICRHETRDRFVARLVRTHGETNTEVPSTPTSQVGLPPTITVFGRYKLAIHALHRVASVVSRTNPSQSNFSANRILPSSYLFLGGKEVGGLLVIILQF
jgi:hypothetical protein